MLDYASPEIKNLYQWLEEDFDPLKLCKDVETVTNILSENEEMSTYVQPLQDIAVVKLLNQVCTYVNFDLEMSYKIQEIYKRKQTPKINIL